MLLEKGIEPQYPWVEYADHLLFYLFEELRPVRQHGGDTSPHTYQEIESWARQTGVPLQPWEVLGIVDLSWAYWHQAAISKDPHCKSPWEPEMLDRKVISDGVEDVFRMLQKVMERKKAK